MPKPLSVQEIKDLDNNSNFACFKGTVKKVMKFAPGPAKEKSSIQGAILVDSTGEEIKVTFKDCKAMAPKEWEGQFINIVAFATDKGGFTGLKAKDDDYDKKNKRTIWITDSATITKGAELKTIEPTAEPVTEPVTAPATAPAATPTDDKPRDFIREAKEIALKAGNLRAIALRVADYYLKEYLEECRTKGMGVEPDAVLHSDFVSGVYDELLNRGFLDGMPPTKSIYAKSASKPAPPKQLSQQEMEAGTDLGPVTSGDGPV